MMRYDAGTGDDLNWLVAEAGFDIRYQGKCESILCQGNGYLGQRAALEEDYVGQTRNLFVTGTFNRFDENEVTELPNLPDLTRVSLAIDGQPFSMARGELEAYGRVLSLKTGELRRELVLKTPEGKRVRLVFTRFVSLADEHLLGFRMALTPLSDGLDLVVETGIDGRVSNTGSQHFKEGDKRFIDGRILRMTSATTQSEVVCSLHAACVFSVDGQRVTGAPHPVIERRAMSIQQRFSLKAGQTLTMEKLCTVHTSRDLQYHGTEAGASRVEEDGQASLLAAEKLGYAGAFERSRAAWESLWEHQDIRVDSRDGFDQLAVRFALYHLNIMAKKDDPRVGIAAKGLSGEGYKGHSFWDTEIFILPYFTFTQPAAARTLLNYRALTLPGARRKARENGYLGAMYPWESAWLSDGEVTPLWGAADIVTGLPMKIWTGLIEQHISADIAFAAWQYFEVTGDRAFMEEAGYEIILDTARFWASRATWNEEKQHYEYLGVIGPDEYKEHIDNNAFTNYMAAWNMRKALDIMDTLPAENPGLYGRLKVKLDLDKAGADLNRVLAGLYLPLPSGEGILPQFDGFFDLKTIDLSPYKKSKNVGAIYRDYNNTQLRDIQVSKQADVLVLFLLLEDAFAQELKEKNYHFYEARTLHDSSLSKSTHAVLAADLGLEGIAYDFFRGSAEIDLGPNMESSDMGIHSASMGGIWQAAVYGFGGVRVKGGRLHLAPRLPHAWSGLAFGITFQGNELRVEAGRKELTIHHRGETPVEVLVDGNPVTLQPGQKFSALR